jgi:hypothetical protein
MSIKTLLVTMGIMVAFVANATEDPKSGQNPFRPGRPIVVSTPEDGHFGGPHGARVDSTYQRTKDGEIVLVKETYFPDVRSAGISYYPSSK